MNDTTAQPRRRWSAGFTATELIAYGLFAIAGSIVGLAFAIAYVGMAVLSFMGAQWQWAWE